MKRLAIVLACLAAGAGSAQAETEFEGSLCINAVTAGCQPDWGPGACFTARYAPRNVGTNGADTELSIFDRTFAMGLRLSSGNPVAPDFYLVSFSKVARGGSVYRAGFKFISQSPAAPTTSTNSIILSGAFSSWDNITNCTVGFRAALTRKP